MKLGKYATAGWMEGSYPYPHTLAELVSPDTSFAIVCAELDPDQRETVQNWLVEGLPAGYQLDGGTGAKKSGEFIISNGEALGPLFWDTPEEVLAYMSNLFTPSWASKPFSQAFTVLVVEDGERGTGDCHGKASHALWELLGGDIHVAGQFRFASRKAKVLAKGTLVADATDGFDLVLPVSAFKSSYKPEPGIYKWSAFLGIPAWSKVIPTKVSWQITQFLTWASVEADLLPRVRAAAVELLTAMSDTRSLVKLLKLDANDIELDVIRIIEADEHGLLSHHPHIIKRCMDMLQLRWKGLAHGGGARWYGLMALPDDSLPFGVVATNELPTGDVITTRYPLRSWMDLRVWQNVVASSPVEGVVYMSHETAACLGGDFDGDYFQLAPVEDYPAIAEEIRGWAGDEVAITKVKDRLASPMDQENLARVMMDNAESKVGIIALLIARAMVSGQKDLVPELAQQLQMSVDMFKYDVHTDNVLLGKLGKKLPRVAWLKDRDNKAAYTVRPMELDSADTVGLLVQRVNAHWQKYQVEGHPLKSFRSLLPKPTSMELLKSATALNQRFGKLMAEIAEMTDESEASDARDQVFDSLKDWAAGVSNPTEWAEALWFVTHKESSQGRGSLPFLAFPMEIAEMVTYAQPETIRVVGVTKNDFDDTQAAAISGSRQNVTFALREFEGMVRTAALLDDKLFGFVSQDQAVGLGDVQRRITLLNGSAHLEPCELVSLPQPSPNKVALPPMAKPRG